MLCLKLRLLACQRPLHDHTSYNLCPNIKQVMSHKYTITRGLFEGETRGGKSHCRRSISVKIQEHVD